MPASSDNLMKFSPEEMEKIRERMGMARAEVVCPRCANTLVLVGPIAGVGTTRRYFEVVCRPCNRSGIVTEVPGFLRSDA